jgi:hypothetical protein
MIPPQALIISFVIMTISRVATTDHYTIRSFAESGKNEGGIDTPGAHYTYDPDIGSIFHPGGSCKVSSRIGAPVAEK